MIATTPSEREPAERIRRSAQRHTELIARVEQTRRDCRRFLLMHAGLWTLLAVLSVAGLLATADYWWVLSPTVRLTGWALAGVAFAAGLVRRSLLIRRTAADRRETAVEIETAYPALGQRVCTTLEYAAPTSTTMPAWPAMVRALTLDTEERTYRLDFTHVVPWRRLRWPAWMTGVLATIFLVAVAVSPAARIAALRLFLLPFHYTQIAVEPGDTSVKVGTDVTIRAILSGRPVTKLELHWRNAVSDDEWTTVSLGPDDSQGASLIGTFEKPIKNCQENLDYRVTADSVESETYRLTIIHPLILRKISATIEPPAYTRKKPTKVAEGDFEAIEGSAVRFRFELDRPPQSAMLQLTSRDKSAPAKPLPPVPLRVDGKALTGALANVTRDLEYQIDAESSEGMRLEPRRFCISVKPDAKPTIHFIKPEVVIEALPTSEVTMQVEANDDFGLTKLGIVYQIGDGPKRTLRLEKSPQQPVSLTTLAKLYLEEHTLSHKDALVYYAFAEDNYPSGPHRVESELQFIDIRAYKREFEVGQAKGKGKSVSLELLIGRQRTNLQHTFTQCDKERVDDRIARRIARAEKSLAKMTAEFTAAMEEQFGPIPCLEMAVEAMKSAVTELEKKDMKAARGAEEYALAQLILARENLRQLLVNPRTAAESEKLDYQAQKNMPEMPKDDDKNDDEQTPDDDILKQIAELAKTEQEMADKLEGKSGSSSNQSQASKNNDKPSSAKSESQSGQQSQSGQPSQSGAQSQQAGQPKDGSSSDDAASLAQRQERAAQQAAELSKKMQDDEAMTELANERMANAEKAIQSSAKSLNQGNKGNAGQEAREAAEQLDRLARQVAALKASELAEKLEAAEGMARQLAQQQREAGQGEGKNQSQSPSQSQSQSQSQGQQGQSPGSEGDSASAGPGRSGRRQHAQAEEARTVADVLDEAEQDAALADPGLVRALEAATRSNSPKEIAAAMDRAARALSAGQRQQAESDIRESAGRLEALANQLEEARHAFAQPTLETLLAAEKKAAELQKELQAPVEDQRRGEVEKEMADLHRKLLPLRGTDPNLRKEINFLADAIEGGSSAGHTWRQTRQGYYTPPELYPSAIQRVDRALQVRIQELILKDAVLDQDQPVPEQYRKHVEQYYRTLSEDLR
jgi:hypothetical protein